MKEYDLCDLDKLIEDVRIAQWLYVSFSHPSTQVSILTGTSSACICK